jgi:hypothetical protein
VSKHTTGCTKDCARDVASEEGVFLHCKGKIKVGNQSGSGSSFTLFGQLGNRNGDWLVANDEMVIAVVVTVRGVIRHLPLGLGSAFSNGCQGEMRGTEKDRSHTFVIFDAQDSSTLPNLKIIRGKEIDHVRKTLSMECRGKWRHGHLLEIEELQTEVLQVSDDRAR